MNEHHYIPGWSIHAQQVAWFEAWLRGRRSGAERLAERAAAELRTLGVEVRAVPGDVA